MAPSIAHRRCRAAIIVAGISLTALALSTLLSPENSGPFRNAEIPAEPRDRVSLGLSDVRHGESSPSQLAWSQTPQAHQLAVQLAVVCPQAAHAWQQELAAGQGLGGTVPAYSEVAVRVAQSTGPWLVDPDNWFVDEDESASGGERVVERDEGDTPATAPADERRPQPLDAHLPQLEAPAPTLSRERVPADIPAPTPRSVFDPPPIVEPEVAPALPIEPYAASPTITSHGAADRDAQIPVGDLEIPSPGADAPGSPAESRNELPFAPPPIPQQPTAAEEVDAPVGFEPTGGRLPSPHGAAAANGDPTISGEEAHRELLSRNCFPSARECAKCHQKIYDEWAISSHAYAFVSPMFQKFEQKIREVSRGTVGHFCYRCHAPVATTLGVGQDVPLWELSQVEREGVTCIACHRVKYRYTKSNGERRIEPGDIYDPVYGGIGGDGIAKAIANADTYKVKTSPADKGPGQAIHREGRYFDQLGRAEFCTSCHQVAVHPGIKLEVVWEQYRQSPAYRKGITCQDCHMGRVPGIASGYEVCAIAEVNEKTVNDARKHGNHTFYGPGYSIAHPGVFPFHEKADRWTMDQWLQFDWRAGWGTDSFEDALDAGKIKASFPAVWANVDDRYDAREIVDDNRKRLARKTELRRQVMENGSHVDGPFFKRPPRRGQDLVLHYHVSNTNEGHNLPTASLGAQPQLWANVVLIDPDGQRVWETGYTDHWGDLCDIHSEDVRKGIAPFDSQLFNLQTMFLITGATGTDREFFLPVNVDFDQLPFLRPGAIPTTVTNHPPFIRMESRSIAPLGVKRVRYKIPGQALCKPGTYRLSFRMRSRTEPIYFMRFCESSIEMQRAMNEGILDVHPYSVEFVVE